MKQILAGVLVLATLAGCGTNSASLINSQAPGQMAAQNKQAQSPSYEAGLTAGLAEAAAVYKTKAPTLKAAPAQGAVVQTEYDLGYIIGMLRGIVNGNGSVHYDYDIVGWMTLSNFGDYAMMVAQDTIDNNPVLAKKYAHVIQIFKDAYNLVDAPERPYNTAEKWHEKYDYNLKAIKRALAELQR